MYNFFVFPEYKTFLLRSRVFARALGCGARRGPSCTRRSRCGFRSGSMARAPPSHFPVLAATETTKYGCVDIGYAYCAVCATCGSARLCAGTPQFSFLIFFCFDCCCCTYHAVCIAPSLKLSSSLLGDGHGTTAAVAHQLLL